MRQGAKIYLAGPTVFFPNHAEVAQRYKDLCEARGVVGLYPRDATKGLELTSLTKPQIAMRIYDALLELLESSDAVVADLTPFRGPSADAGTVWEVAYAIAKGKPVTAFNNDSLPYRDKVQRIERIVEDDGVWRDEAGMEVEDCDLQDNLMIVGGLRSAPDSVGIMYRSFEEALDALLRSEANRS
jgi:nucleoside 2-deoxyribosyltransferase